MKLIFLAKEEKGRIIEIFSKPFFKDSQFVKDTCFADYVIANMNGDFKKEEFRRIIQLLDTYNNYNGNFNENVDKLVSGLNAKFTKLYSGPVNIPTVEHIMIADKYGEIDTKEVIEKIAQFYPGLILPLER